MKESMNWWYETVHEIVCTQNSSPSGHGASRASRDIITSEEDVSPLPSPPRRSLPPPPSTGLNAPVWSSPEINNWRAWSPVNIICNTDQVYAWKIEILVRLIQSIYVQNKRADRKSILYLYIGMHLYTSLTILYTIVECHVSFHDEKESLWRKNS